MIVDFSAIENVEKLLGIPKQNVGSKKAAHIYIYIYIYIYVCAIVQRTSARLLVDHCRRGNGWRGRL